jgi:Ni/Co efflux regulator RcnB
MRKMLFAVLTTLLSAIFFACTAAPQIESGSVALENKDIKAVMIFSSGDREKISHYYKSRKRTKALPPGLAKKKELPPGLQKHLQKYDELPPGLEGNKLPQDLDRTLTRLPEGYVRLKVGGDVVLMNEKTRVVFDVIWDLD